VRAVFLDFDTVSAGDLDLTTMQAAVDELQLFDSDPGRTTQRIRDAQVVLVNRAPLDRDAMLHAAGLAIIATAGTGTNHIDLDAARERRIAVCNVTAYCTASVAQQVWALTLGLTQHLGAYDAMVRGGAWTAAGGDAGLRLPIRELAGRAFGVVGWGELGRAAAAIAGAFGMRVLIAGRRGGPTSPGRLPFDEVLAAADILSLHCPLNDATRGLIGARELALMKRDALLINTARGGLIDAAALAAALRAGRLGGAGIDVFDAEPPGAGHPLLEPGIPNLLLTPHVAWAAREARQRCVNEMAAAIRDFRDGGRRGRVV
jgi:glycerate dehydrogenase